jgi:hypothetical protein
MALARKDAWGMVQVAVPSTNAVLVFAATADADSIAGMSAALPVHPVHQVRSVVRVYAVEACASNRSMMLKSRKIVLSE